MTATRSTGLWVRDARCEDVERRRTARQRGDRYFWRGRRWRQIDPREL